MTRVRAPRALYVLGALLVVYLGYPVGAFLVRAIGGSNEGWHDPGLYAALRVSLEGATISLGIGMLGGIPLAYLLARRRGPIATLVTIIVQLPLAVPPLISGILLIYIVGPYTWLGQRSGERLTQTMIGVIIAMSFVSTPFLVVAARSAFRAVDPALGEVAATLGHGRLSRFLRVEVPAAGDGIRAGMILMWLRAFGEYGTVVILAYHPYTLPVYVENLFSSAPLSQAEAPTLLAFGVAVLAILAGFAHRPLALMGRRARRLPPAVAPSAATATPVSFQLDARVQSFHLHADHAARGHRLAVVGPSGAGKSVLLRALAGLLGSGAGTVRFGAEAVTSLAPERRRLGYVPQGYALAPGVSVWKQVTFGVGADPARAAWWLATLGIAGLADRRPDQLSGGQRQRVSLARALALEPRVVLLDEPFSALDAPVRAELRAELRRLQLDLGLSTVLVTHDPEEAAMLADEIVVLGDGEILQAGECREVFSRPASAAIGRLLGLVNLYEGPPPEGVGRFGQSEPDKNDPPPLLGGSLWHVPPECVHVSAAGEADGPGIDLGPGRVRDVIDLGARVEVVVALDRGEEIRARVLDVPELGVGDACRAFAEPGRLSTWSVAGLAGPATNASPR